MKISTKGRYALRMLIDLAEHREDGYITLKEIADRQDISKKYLEQIVPLLNRTGILQANRGFQGGYRLAKPTEQCTVGEILRLTEGDLAPVSCLTKNAEKCPQYAECSTISVWEGLQRVINEYLDGITLQDLLDKKQKGYPDDYII
jgi:Rrf2 family protein